MDRTFALYDTRYTSDPDSAIAFCFYDTLKEAIKHKNDWGGSVIVQYDVEEEELINPTIIEINIPPNGKN